MRAWGSYVDRLRDDETWGGGYAVVMAAVLIVAATTAFRGWAIYAGWFYEDDYILLRQSRGEDLTLGHLLEPYASYLMPGERLVMWSVANAGVLNWTLAATLMVGAQAMAGLAAAWMFFTLFGVRWATLALLGTFLTTSLTVQVTVWLAPAFNQLPLQIAFFTAVGCWVRHLRGEGRRWLVGTLAAVCLGLFFYVKTVLLLPVLAFLALAYFATGGWRERLRQVLVGRWPAVVAAAVIAATYGWYSLTHVERPFVPTSSGVAADVAESMIGTAFATAVVGGPWTWSQDMAPTVGADPPLWARQASWVAIALVVAYAALRREHTGRAWVLLLGYVALDWLLLVNSRAPLVGAVAGLQYRYVADAAAVLALCLGLAFLPLRGAAEPSRPRSNPLLVTRVPARWAGAGVALVCVMGLVSSAGYVTAWHEGNRSRDFSRTFAAELGRLGRVDLVNRSVPPGVISTLHAPDNTVSVLSDLLSAGARYPETTDSLAVVTDEGLIKAAIISPATKVASGPRPSCGHSVGAGGRTMRLGSELYAWEWWARIGYMASADSPITVVAGSLRHQTTVQRGLNNLFVHLPVAVDSVRLEGLREGVRLCVDTVEVGLPVPGGDLS